MQILNRKRANGDNSMTTETNGNIHDYIEGPLARPVGLWLTSPAIQAGAEQSRYMPFLQHLSTALLASQARLSWLRYNTTSYNNQYYPLWESNMGIKPMMFFASQHYICTPTMTDMVWRPSADPECPPYEHSQVSLVQVWLWSDLCW